jgi:antitoxin component HigA of HigAB toxin-antitoxin module
MTARLIQNSQEYREARQTIRDLLGLDKAPGTPKDDRLLTLASDVERYEVQHVLDLPADAGYDSRWACIPL